MHQLLSFNCNYFYRFYYIYWLTSFFVVFHVYGSPTSNWTPLHLQAGVDHTTQYNRRISINCVNPRDSKFVILLNVSKRYVDAGAWCAKEGVNEIWVNMYLLLRSAYDGLMHINSTYLTTLWIRDCIRRWWYCLLVPVYIDICGTFIFDRWCLWIIFYVLDIVRSFFCVDICKNKQWP